MTSLTLTPHLCHYRRFSAACINLFSTNNYTTMMTMFLTCKIFMLCDFSIYKQEETIKKCCHVFYLSVRECDQPCSQTETEVMNVSFFCNIMLHNWKCLSVCYYVTSRYQVEVLSHVYHVFIITMQAVFQRVYMYVEIMYHCLPVSICGLNLFPNLLL